MQQRSILPQLAYWVLSIFLTASPSYAQSVAGSTNPAHNQQDCQPLNPLKFKGSLHSILMSRAGSESGVTFNVGDLCLRAIQNVLKSGGNFKTRTIQDHLVKVADWPNAQVRQQRFFHYTDHPAVRDAVLNGDLDGIFAYLRIQHGNGYYLYVAADPQSSRRYGKIQIQFSFSPEALIFNPELEGMMITPLASKIYEEIENELILRTPELEVCRAKWDVHPFIPPTLDRGPGSSVLVELSTEASGAALRAYIDDEINRPWFEMIGPWAPQTMSVGEDRR